MPQDGNRTGGDQPPAYSPMASRYRLVRPLQGRYVAGVCAAIGRATNTDPVLWRVLLGVLFCFFGAGALVYLVGWLLIPEEGDSSSPVEALLGRGISSTSPVLTAVLGLVALVLMVVIVPQPSYLILVAGIVLLVFVLLTRHRPAQPAPGPAQAAPASTGAWPDHPTVATPVPAAPGVPFNAAPPAAPASGPPPAGSLPSDAPPSDALPSDTLPSDTLPPGALPADAAPADAISHELAREPVPAPERLSPAPPGALGPGGYREPFAPHGPFAGPIPPPPPPPPPAHPPRERSALPALTFFAMLMGGGALGALDVTGLVDIPTAGYVAAALAVVGTGLVVGTWLGRGRSLIALGAVLALALPAAHAADTWDRPDNLGGDHRWAPESTVELEDDYSLMFGNGVLDLREVEMAGQEVQLAAEVSFGEMTIIVPPDVTVEADVTSRFGTATVFDTTVNDVNEQTIRDSGSGDPADGTLHLDLRTSFGNLSVDRR